MGRAKDGTNEQWGITTIDGNASAPIPADTLANRGRAPMVDLAGRLVVRLADAGGFVGGGFSTRVQVDSGGALVRWALMSALPCQLRSFSAARQTGTGNRFVQLYDIAAGPPPAATRPAVSMLWDGGMSFRSLDAPEWIFANGLVVAISQNSAIDWNDPGADQWTWQCILNQ